MSAAMRRSRRPSGDAADNTDERQVTHYTVNGILIEFLSLKVTA